MQFHYGHPPTPEVPFDTPVKLDIDYARLHVQALILALLVLGPLIYWIGRPYFSLDTLKGVFELGPFAFLGLLFLTIIVHEGLHLLTHPGFGFSRSSYCGVLPKSFLIYASYQGTQSRARVLITLVALFLVLTFGLFAASVFGWIPIAFGIVMLNGMASAGDLLSMWMVITKIPAGARISGEYFEGRPSTRP